ncbi:MAG TPA: type II toxin-antitoxin system RelE/ParE family toxin [Candidatus Sulfopaludibacter sp.]|nr:type II toxin-antitoxin system RelE/ParE family toxin [Candidatus Sulfopaludibacter sp.]HUC83857.1 type II toxin-antitoxin system RelE/ParE family toxin [Candidatus Acidoferrales bacterium]
MADYSISFARPARKELERLPGDIAGRILAKVEALAKNPRTVGDVKLHGQKNLWRICVGDYRVVDSINDFSRMIDVAVIRHRRDVYRDL